MPNLDQRRSKNNAKETVKSKRHIQKTPELYLGLIKQV